MTVIGRIPPAPPEDSTSSRIDTWLSRWIVSASYTIRVAATPDGIYRAVLGIDLSRSFLVRTLFAARTFSLPFGRFEQWIGFTFHDLLKSGFILLEENPPKEIILGIVGKFWRMDGCVQRMSASEFARFEEPGFAKAVWNFHIANISEGTCMLTTETRVHCTDDASARKFRLYWSAVRPFSGLIRKEALRMIKRDAERGAG